MSVDQFLILAVLSGIILIVVCVCLGLKNYGKSIVDLNSVNPDDLKSIAEQFNDLNISELKFFIPKTIFSENLAGSNGVLERVAIEDSNRKVLAYYEKRRFGKDEILLTDGEKVIVNRNFNLFRGNIRIEIAHKGETVSCKLYPRNKWISFFLTSSDKRKWMVEVLTEKTCYFLSPCSSNKSAMHELKNSSDKTLGFIVQCVPGISYRSAVLSTDIDEGVIWAIIYIGLFEVGVDLSD